MNVRILQLASAAYACITHGTRTLDLKLAHGVAPVDSLRATAVELQRQADLLTMRAALARQAADWLDTRNTEARERQNAVITSPTTEN